MHVLSLDELDVFHGGEIGDHHRRHAAAEIVVVAATGVVIEVKNGDSFRRVKNRRCARAGGAGRRERARSDEQRNGERPHNDSEFDGAS